MKNHNKVLIILSVIFVLIAVAFLIVGFALAGADILGWFSSKWAMMFYVTFGVYALVVISILLDGWIRKL